MSEKTVTPRPASTILLLRDAAAAQDEIEDLHDGAPL